MDSKNVESMLDELVALLKSNYQLSNGLLDNLQTLVEDSANDSAKNEALMAMRADFGPFMMSMADLRDGHISIIESYNTKLKLGPSADVAKSRLTASIDKEGNITELLQSIYEISESYNLHMEHINLIGRLSSKLCDTALYSSKTALGADDELDIDHILDAYETSGDGDVKDIEYLKSRLLGWVDSHKMEKARYTLENQHILRDKLRDMTSEVTRWKANYESIENTMFGDDAHSITQTLRRIENLKPQLEKAIPDKDVMMS
ncbi:LAME_0B07690g1_1 [Lachancea meyersii CBS 8951]|uniref:LAME_0B07690g1_1 n=1 Tax=Lachancea meyersii CBS 8951 TaxID=1266667 RepID=A0A1G4IWT4_9SACH|nr:LAME_0B07690g1_1 [Lachancea meyersii CBS 8951]